MYQRGQSRGVRSQRAAEAYRNITDSDSCVLESAIEGFLYLDSINLPTDPAVLLYGLYTFELNDCKRITYCYWKSS